MKIFYITSTLILVLTGCTSTESCFKAEGASGLEPRSVPFFNKVVLEGEIQVRLHNGTGLSIEAGENLRPYIDTQVSDSTLLVKSNLSCQWARGYPDIKVYIGIQEVSYIQALHYGDLRSTETLKVGYLQIDNLKTSPILVLDLEAEYISLFTNSGASITLQGKTNQLNIYTLGYGKIETAQLEAQQVNVRHGGQNTVRVQPVVLLEASLEDTGNLIYIREPQQKKVDILYTGQLIFSP